MRWWTVISLAVFFPVGCGLDGGIASINDPAPGGTVIYHGSIATNGVGATGSVKIHNVGGQVVVRLEGLSTPSDTRYFIFLDSSTTQSAYVSQLKGTAGNQNFYTGITQTTQDWIQLVFRGANNSTFPSLASAQLDP